MGNHGVLMKKIQGQSFLATEEKERGLFSTFQSNLSIFHRLKMRYRKSNFRYFHFDLNSGNGWNDDVGCIGSPIAFVNAALSTNVDCFYAGFCDNNPKAINQLRERVEIATDERCACFCENNSQFIHRIPSIIEDHGEKPDKVIGMILCDPNGTDIPIDGLKELSNILPKMDIAIHWNSAQFKRDRCTFGVNRPTLEKALSSIKKENWLIRKYIGHYQWTMLIGRNYNINNKLDGFYPLNSPSGQSIFARCNYTNNELKEFRGCIPTNSIHQQAAIFI